MSAPRSSVFTFESTAHSSHVLSSLDEQRRRDVLCDVTVVVEGQSFRAHRSVLASCSEYFAQRISSFTQHGAVVTLPQEVTVTGFEPLLKFAYTSKLLFGKEDVLEIRNSAVILGFKDLDEGCFEFLLPKFLSTTTKGPPPFKRKTCCKEKSKRPPSEENSNTDSDSVLLDEKEVQPVAESSCQREVVQDCNKSVNNKVGSQKSTDTSALVAEGTNDSFMQCPKYRKFQLACGKDASVTEKSLVKTTGVRNDCVISDLPCSSSANSKNETKTEISGNSVLSVISPIVRWPISSQNKAEDKIEGEGKRVDNGFQEARKEGSKNGRVALPVNNITAEKEMAESLARQLGSDIDHCQLNFHDPKGGCPTNIGAQCPQSTSLEWPKHNTPKTSCPLFQDLDQRKYSWKGEGLSECEGASQSGVSSFNSGEDGDSETETEGDSESSAIERVQLPFSVDWIVELSRNDFQQLLKQHAFTREQLDFVHDMRRRSKNRLAAQRCRKRKLDCIYNLQCEINKLSQLSQLKLKTCHSVSALCQRVCSEANLQPEQLQVLAKYTSPDCPLQSLPLCLTSVLFNLLPDLPLFSPLSSLPLSPLFSLSGG
uniref:Transcription regulator protein BACH1 n=1 Tax=Maylandia zebra TaxID=106582 RepID=A0A3P9DDB4_9CICH